jgi:hypothetical protein
MARVEKCCNPDVFWGEIRPCEHFVQIYDEDDVFMDTLEGFVAGGLQGGDAVIVIATTAHLKTLHQRLRARGIDLGAARVKDQFISPNAEVTLARFMVDGWPDEQRFREVVRELLERAQKGGRRVRAFGEMVALLWAQGMNGATVRLEHLWEDFCNKEGFSLFCAYPKSGFTGDAASSIHEICAAHSRVVYGVRDQLSAVE